jgi:DTW domain-containing protein
MRSRTLSDLPGRCHACYLKSEFCLCADLPKIATRARFVVVRHVREAFKSTNTGRIAALALTNCEILEYESATDEFDAKVRALEGAVLLFPAAAGEPERALSVEPRHVLVLDGTWRQTRRMLSRVSALQVLPRLSLPPPKVVPRRLRQSPSPDSMSTLEAIAGAVAQLEGEDQARALDELHARMVERTLVGRGAIRREAVTL